MSALKSPGPVTTVVAAWEPAVSNDENPNRGFGGRVYFYDSDNRPVKAKGTVVVYAFDEEGRASWDAKPNEGYVFDSQTLNSKGVYSKSKLGHSYSLWIPIDKARPENPSRKISLIVRYIPEQGSPRVSKQTTVYLPGRRDQEKLIVQNEISEWDGPSQRMGVHSAATRPLSEQTKFTEERTMVSNADRPQTLQSVIIR